MAKPADFSDEPVALDDQTAQAPDDDEQLETDATDATEDASQLDPPTPDEEESTEEAAEKPGETKAETPQDIRDWVRTQLPQYSGIIGRYQNDQDFLVGLLNTATKIGERDEYAELGRLVAQRKDDVLRFLQGGGQPAPQPQTQVNETATYEQVAAWRAAVQANPENPPQEAVQGLARATDDMQRFVFQLKREPEKVLGPIFSQYAQQMQQQVVQLTAQQQAAMADNAALAQMAQQSKDLLFIDGDVKAGLTPLGARMDQYWREERAMGAANSVAFQRAKWRVDSEQLSAIQQQRAPNKPKPTAGRKPNVAVPAGGRTAKDENKLIAHETLAQSLIRKMKEMDAGGLG